MGWFLNGVFVWALHNFSTFFNFFILFMLFWHQIKNEHAYFKNRTSISVSKLDVLRLPLFLNSFKILMIWMYWHGEWSLAKFLTFEVPG